ncbi:MAG: isopentenyl-diphosphate Delta-isomerase [Candidatus Levybacteria bacterium]|nr:isopentenyl-diphosphate Delta-isomerase [Candidatus Levybacteria bacterium]
MEKTINNDYVVLVDENNKVLGTAPKLKTHNSNTRLHRGFSLFLFNKKGNLLLQQRSHTKKTFPLVWSNSVCGHPMLNESNIEASKRRLRYELGIDQADIFEIISNYKYKVAMNNIFENEICPVLIAFSEEKPIINKDEVENIRWVNWDQFVKEVKQKSGIYSLWCEEETKLLCNNKKFLKLYKQHVL